MISEAWRQYARRYRPQRWLLALCSSLAAGQFLLIAPTLLLVRMIFDRALPQRDLTLLTLAGCGVAALHLANAGVTLAVRHMSLRITKQVIRDVRAELIGKLFSVSRNYWSHSDHSALQARIVNDTERVDHMSNMLICDALPALMNAAAVSVALLWLNARLYGFLLLLVPISYGVNRLLSPVMQRTLRAYRRSFEGFHKGVAFVLQTMDLARIQSAENWEIQRQAGRTDDLQRTGMRMAWVETSYRVIQQNVATLGTVVLLVGGGLDVAGGRMSLGSLMSFYLAMGLLTNYFRTLVAAGPNLWTGTAALEALHSILSVTDLEPYRGDRRIAFQGELALRGVRFRYGDNEVLRGVDLTIEAGSRTAICGSNGGGKTTLLYLLCGLYRPASGTVLADGVSYEELDVRALRESLGVVQQDPVIFSGTIWENITYGLPEASVAEVREAARLATADDFIVELADGYETRVGEGGVLLSGGQRQRIAIARALLRRPKVLILDEPTNHLDAAAVRGLLATLRALPTRPTLLVITHSREVLREFDVVYEVEDGRIACRGGVEELAGVRGRA